MLSCFFRPLCRGATAKLPAAPSMRLFSSVKFLEQKRSGEETVFFKKEDEALLRRLLANHPEADPKFRYTAGEASLESLQSALALCVSKHMNAQAPKALLDELAAVFVQNGWTPPPDQKEALQSKPAS